MIMSRPAITMTTHVLPLERLSWVDFERLSLALLLREGFSQVQHYGALGSEHGRDIVAQRNGERWYVQCKRVKECGPQTLLAEIEKIAALATAEPHLRPHGILFMLSLDVSAQARDRASERCAELGMQCEIWGETDLDARIRLYPDIVSDFFGRAAQGDVQWHLLDIPTGDSAEPADDLTPEEETLLQRHAFETPQDLEHSIENAQRLLQIQHKQWAKIQVAGAYSSQRDDALAEASYLEDEAETQKGRLAELQRTRWVAARLNIPPGMLLKDFLEGNIYGMTIRLFAQDIKGDLDPLALVQRISADTPAYRKRVALRLLKQPDAADETLAQAIRPMVDGFASQPGNGYIRLPGGKYRRIRF